MAGPESTTPPGYLPSKPAFKSWQERPGGIPRDTAIEQRARSGLKRPSATSTAGSTPSCRNLRALIKSAELGEADPAWIERANSHSRQLQRQSPPLCSLSCYPSSPIRYAMSWMPFRRTITPIWKSITCHMDALMLARQKSYRRLKTRASAGIDQRSASGRRTNHHRAAGPEDERS